MAVFSALRSTPGALGRNPVVFVPVAAVMILQLPQIALQVVAPEVGRDVSMVLSVVFLGINPFFLGGFVGMADEALGADTSLATFLAAGRSNYEDVFVGYFLVMAVGVVCSLVAGVVVSAITGFDSMLVILLAYLLFVFLVQFYSQAIVIEGLNAVDGVKHSVTLVRDHPTSTLGYSLVSLVGMLVGFVERFAPMLVSSVSSWIADFVELSLEGAVAAMVGLAVVASLVDCFFGVYHVAFYREING